MKNKPYKLSDLKKIRLELDKAMGDGGIVRKSSSYLIDASLRQQLLEVCDEFISLAHLWKRGKVKE